MQLIVGLGNPGNQYNFTRHNLGFLVLDFYAKLHQLNWSKHPKFHAEYIKNGQHIFIKPQTFYNESGLAVRAFADFYKITPDNILVVCDDFNLPFGTLRYRPTGTAGGNNGLKSIAKHLGTNDFPRLRIGSNNDTIHQKLGDTDFVLGKFTPEEKTKLPTILTSSCSRLDSLLNP